MKRRSMIAAGVAALLGLFLPNVANAAPATGKSVLAVSVFGGQGNQVNVDTGLRYNGVAVSPTFVTITPQGYGVSHAVGVNPHQSDTKIDVQCANVAWIGKAEYIA